jgi:hypothetical protein
MLKARVNQIFAASRMSLSNILAPKDVSFTANNFFAFTQTFKLFGLEIAVTQI